MSALVSLFRTFVSGISNFFSSCLSVLNYIFSIFKTLWYGLTSLISGIGSLINDVFNGTFSTLFIDGFNKLSFFVGGFWAFFLYSLMLIIFLRIIIAFIFKIFRLNVDYKKDSKL